MSPTCCQVTRVLYIAYIYITRPTLKIQDNDQTALENWKKIYINLPKQTLHAIFTANIMNTSNHNSIIINAIF